jgi:hypothetical protein
MIFIAVTLLTFAIMEGITWLTHRYVMHGFLWYLHEDHHQPTGHFFEKNDAFFLIFAIPSWLCIMLGSMAQNYWSVGIGAGIAMYGFAYFLVHEIIKGLYEIISLQGFTKDVSTNADVAAAADKLEYEPEDFGTGTHILADLKALYTGASVRDKISFELFLANLYREDDAAAFVAFIENLLNNRLTSSQKQWAQNHMEPTPNEDEDEDDIDNISLADLGLEENKKPYKDLKVTKDYILREFNKDVNPIELKWHRDKEDRIVEIVGKTDWKIQLENQLPTSINESIFIPKGEWHRLIKGNGTLVLKINKK